jgi:hypothetical protein
MKTFAKFAGFLIAGVIVGGLLFPAVNGGKSLLGGIYHQTTEYFQGGLQIGDTGTAVSKVITGTVNCSAGAPTVAASNVSNYACSVTGVVSGDKVFASLTNTPVGIFIAGVTASTTAGSIQLTLGNASTTAAAVGSATTSVQYWITR